MNQIRIEEYDESKRSSWVDLRLSHYGGSRDYHERFLDDFYGHPYQKEHGLLIVAMDGAKVCGFQSYFAWPYRKGATEYASLQSGNSLVSSDYRGQGLFARLLNYVDERPGHEAIDFLVGFPEDSSYGSFIRNGWVNPLNLSWHARVLRPGSLLAGQDVAAQSWLFDRAPEFVEPWYPSDHFTMSLTPGSVDWRASYRVSRGELLYFHHKTAAGSIRFELKPNRRGRVQELVIGGIIRSSGDPSLLADGIRHLVKVARQHRFLTTLTIAFNERQADQSLRNALRRHLFVPVRKQIYFIVKPMNVAVDQVADPTNWSLLRSDIDTW